MEGRRPSESTAPRRRGGYRDERRRILFLRTHRGGRRRFAFLLGSLVASYGASAAACRWRLRAREGTVPDAEECGGLFGPLCRDGARDNDLELQPRVVFKCCRLGSHLSSLSGVLLSAAPLACLPACFFRQRASFALVLSRRETTGVTRQTRCLATTVSCSLRLRTPFSSFFPLYRSPSAVTNRISCQLAV